MDGWVNREGGVSVYVLPVRKKVVLISIAIHAYRSGRLPL